MPKRLGVLVVCPSSLADSVREAITRRCRLRWQDDDAVRLLVIPEEQAEHGKYVSSQIKKLTKAGQRRYHVMSVGSVECGKDLLPDELMSNKDLRLSQKAFVERRLPKVLGEHGLDWLSQVAETISDWTVSTVNSDTIKRWLRQFDRVEPLESHSWVGERLLRVLDFWSTQKLNTALRLTPQELLGFDYVCVNGHRLGNSAAALSYRIEKSLPSGSSSVAIFDQVVRIPGPSRLLLIEDCMLTGFEITSLLGSLLGCPPLDAKPTVAPLSTPSLLKEKKIKLRVAVAANWGLAALRKFCDEHGLDNIEVEPPAVELTTLTQAGLSALAAGGLFDDEYCLVDPPTHVSRLAFQSLTLWRDHDGARRAAEICGRIGEQLYRRHLDLKGKSWPQRRIAESAFGVRYNGLALAFSHSVPKETLPLFWIGGEVEILGRATEWEPLFPSGREQI